MTQKLTVHTMPQVNQKLDAYPDHVQDKMKNLRNLIIETAEEIGITTLEECLKWGEPSYIAKHGSTLRMDWKSKSPQQYAMYFNCSSRLVETFRTLYTDIFTFEGNRAIIFQLDDSLPIAELKACISATLRYHKVKNHPTLGI